MFRLIIPRYLTTLFAPLFLAIAFNAVADPGGPENEFDRGAMAHRQRDYPAAFKIWLPWPKMAMWMRSTTSPACCKTATGQRKTPVRRLRGSARRRNRATRSPNIIWG